MNNIKRVYEEIARRHFDENRQMIFVSGPRQVGKTTLLDGFQNVYLNWDKKEDRELILKGEAAVYDRVLGGRALARMPIVAFDEIHHYKYWKNFLKGFFDAYGKELKIAVIGSARLNVFKKSGDSLMGRYFPYRMHPLSVGELLHPLVKDEEICREPEELPQETWERLLTYGGFPEPFARADKFFWRKWSRLRFEQLMRDDIRKDTAIRELDQLEAMAHILSERSAEQLVYASLGAEVQVSEVTTRNWIAVLNSLYFGFLVRPWSLHIENSIRKTPKWYLRDWSGVSDVGHRHETMVACHLLKAVELWTDLGFGDYDLFYVRNKQKEEVDFLVTKDKRPWFLVEVKSGEDKLSPTLAKFQQKLGCAHAFQVVFDLPFEPVDLFTYNKPVIVPAKTFLGQLM